MVNKNSKEPKHITRLKNGKVRRLNQPYSPKQAIRFRNEGEIK